MGFMILGHRGAKSYYPENTMLSFRKALEMGVNGLETDIRASKDGKLILSCYETTENCTGKNFVIKETLYKDLFELDFGEGEHIVLFEDFIKEFGNKDLYLAIEIKQKGIEKEVIDLLRSCVKDVSKITITSFEFDILRDVRSYDKDINIGYLTDYCKTKELNLLRTINAKQICPKAEYLTLKDVKNAKQNGYTVRAWGVFTEKDMLHCLDCGVNGMTINFPDKLIYELSRRKQN